MRIAGLYADNGERSATNCESLDPARLQGLFFETYGTVIREMSRIRRALPLTIATAFLMEGLDSSVVTTALPAMAHDLGAPTTELAASVTSYLISLAIFMPLGGWLSHRYGARQVFVAALGIFAAGSLLCGIAPNSAALIAGRIVQGMGGAMMTPVGRAILMRSVPKSDFIRAMNYVLIPGLIGPAAGPLVGGFLAAYVSWRWIFLINLPLAVVGIAMSFRFISPEIAEDERKSGPLDWIGYAYLAIALGVGQVAIEMFGHAARLPAAFSVALLATVAAALFLRRYKRIGSGVLDLGLMSIRTFRLSITAGTFARVGLGGVPFLLPLLLQQVFGYNAFRSGLVTFLVAVGSLTVRPLLSLLLRWLSCRRLLLMNSLVGTAALLGFLLFRDKSALWLIAPYVFLFGLTRSVQFSTMGVIIYADIEKRDMAGAATIGSLMQRISAGLGVNIGAIVLTAYSKGSPPDLNAFSFAFAAGALLVAISGGMFTRLHADDGWQVAARTAQDKSKQGLRETEPQSAVTER